VALESSVPDPREAQTPADFVAQLRRLKAWSGLTYRQLEKEAARQGYALPHSTIASALKRASLPREQLVTALVTACGCPRDVVADWAAVRRLLAVGEVPVPPATPGTTALAAEGDPSPAEPTRAAQDTGGVLPSPAGPPTAPPADPVPRPVPPVRHLSQRRTRIGALGLTLLALLSVSASSRPMADAPKETPVRFTAPPPLPAPAGWWTFEESGGPAARDSSGHGAHLRIKGDVTRVAAPRGHALSFGGNGHAVADRPVVRTDAPFTITAWVLLEETGRFGTVVAAHHTGDAPDVVLLDYDSEHHDWAVLVPDRGNGWANGDETVFSGRRPVPGRWTHLAAVFDPDARQLCLYVDGELGACRVRTTITRASGPLDIGRALYEGAAADGWQGAIDDVRIFDVPLSPRQVGQVAAERA
jgi:Concanavalin A-like lectin/glucanases superfamily